MKEKHEQQRIIFLEGKKVILRPLNKDTDLPKAVLWMNDPEVRQFIARVNPLTLAEEEKWFDNLANRDSDILLAIETKKGRHIGILGLHHIDRVNRVAGHGISIGEKDCWGKGYGTDAGMTLPQESPFFGNRLQQKKFKLSSKMRLPENRNL